MASVAAVDRASTSEAESPWINAVSWRECCGFEGVEDADIMEEGEREGEKERRK